MSIRLGEAVETGLRRRAVGAAQQVASVLSGLADEVQAGPEVPGCVLNVSFLVAADRVAECRAAFDGAADRVAYRAELRLTGPLPCYSFSGLPAPAGA